MHHTKIEITENGEMIIKFHHHGKEIILHPESSGFSHEEIINGHMELIEKWKEENVNKK